MTTGGSSRCGSRSLLWLALATAWLLLAQAALTTWAASRALRAAQESRAAAAQVADWTAPQPDELATVGQAIARTERSLSLLRRVCWWAPLLARWQAAPTPRAVGVTLDDGLAATEELAALAGATLREIEGGLPTAGEAQPEHGVAAAAVRALGGEAPGLAAVGARLALVDEALTAADDARLAGLTEGVRLARFVVELAMLAPQIAGETPRTVLLVFQNDDELRPTGGFVSSVAELTVHQGAVSELHFMDSYEVESYRAAHPPPPAPLARWMDAGMLLFRDANWSPDFRQSAEVLAALYTLNMGGAVDLVVAVNASLAGNLLGALGPLALDDYDVVVTEANVREVAATFWAQPLDAPGVDAQGEAWGYWLARRKDIGEALVVRIVEELGRSQPSQWLALARTLADARAHKDLLAWAPIDTALQAALLDAGLAGEVAGDHGDYLLVVEANVGWNKVNRHVSRSLHYDVTLAGQPRAELTLTIANDAPSVGPCVHAPQYGESYEAMTAGCYWSYVRLLVPAGAVLEGADGLASPVAIGHEAGRTVFGGLVLVPAGEALAVRWRYTLPGDLVPCDGQGRLDYRLTVQKQPGVQELPLTMVVQGDGRLTAASHRWTPQPDGSWAARWTLVGDWDMWLALKP